MTYDLTKGPILSHIKRIAVPASLGFLFNTLFNVVDTIYVGRISTEALAGLGLSFPIYFMMIAFASGLGQAITALGGHAIGEKKQEVYDAIIKNGLIFLLILIGLFLLLIPTALDGLFELMGGTEAARDLGTSYVKTIFFGSAFFFVNLYMNGILLTEGHARPYRNVLLIGFLLNIILNPLFIFGWFGLPRLSTTGVALATLIVQGVGTVYLFRQLKTVTHFDFNRVLKTPFSISIFKEITAQAVPVILINSTIAIGVFVINYFTFLYGGDIGLAAYTSALRVEQLLFLPTIGLNIAVLSLASQNIGAKQYERVKQIILTAGAIGLIIMFFATIFILVLAPVLLPFLSEDGAVVDVGVRYLRIATIGFFSYIFINMSSSLMQAFKKPILSTIFNTYRQLIPVVVFPLLAVTFSLGLDGVWVGIVVVNWSAAIFLVLSAYIIFKKEKGQSS